jgi:hypothetical protein
MGISIAKTMSKINAPMKIITIGSSKESNTLRLVSISDFMNIETF